MEKDRYALPLAAVREVVVPPERFTRVPRAPPAVRGVMNLRGRVVTVVELLAAARPAAPAAQPQRRKLVLLDRGRRDLGLLVTDVDGHRVDRESVSPRQASPCPRCGAWPGSRGWRSRCWTRMAAATVAVVTTVVADVSSC